MKNTTEDSLARIRKWCWLAAFLIVLGGLAAIYLVPALRYNHLLFDREEAEARTQEVRERAEAIREEQEKERAERRLTEEHARELTKKIEEKERKEMTRQLKNVRQVYEQLEEERMRKLEELEERSLSERLDLQMEPLRRDMQRTLDAIDSLTRLEADEERNEDIPEGFAESLKENRAEFAELLKQLKEDFDKEALEKVMENAQSIVEKAAAADESENKAFDSQRRQALWAARDALGKARKIIDAPEQIATEMAEAGQKKETSLPPSISEALDQADQKSISELYEAARQMEELMNESLDQSRAAELAARQGTDVETAREKLVATESQMYDIPGLDNSQPPATLGELDQRREAVNEAAREVSRLNQRADQANRQMAGNESEQSSTLSTASSLNQALKNRLDASSKMSETGKVNDVSGLMRMAMGVSGSDQSGADSTDFRNIEGSPESADDLSPDSGQVIDLGGRNIAANALPGRRFTSASARKGWLYLDTWYAIGPWDNDGDLRSFDVPHPPESEINFDGTYSGKVYTPQHARQDAKQGINRGYTLHKQRTLRWNFIQSDSIRTMIPDEVSNATYYLHTDIYFEEGRDMLIAIGSDDSAKVWINGIPVWQDSGKSPWAMGEHFNKVYFRQGYNNILVRLENGPQRCEISFLICPPEVALPHPG